MAAREWRCCAVASVVAVDSHNLRRYRAATGQSYAAGIGGGGSLEECPLEVEASAGSHHLRRLGHRHRNGGAVGIGGGLKGNASAGHGTLR